MSPRPVHLLAVLAVFAIAHPAVADTPDALLRDYESSARSESPAFAGFSAERGARFFRTRQADDWSCATCHTATPTAPGRHARTHAALLPLAPAANPARLTDVAKVEKWFRRNCNDVLSRTCTAQEKGDVLQYLLSLR